MPTLSRLIPSVCAAVLVLALLLCAAPSQATLAAFVEQYQAIMEQAGSGFSMFYEDAVALPTAYVWSCQNATGTAGTVAYASATTPYALSVSTVSLTVQPVTTSSSVTYELFGHSCDFYGSCSAIQSGTAPSFDATPNRVIMVMGRMTSSTSVVNFLPMAYYVVLPIASCSSAGSATITDVFRTGGTITLWNGL